MEQQNNYQSNSKQQYDYQFNMIIIKPNTCEPGSSYTFDENYYKLLNHDKLTGPILNINMLKEKLLAYLHKKDYFEIKSFNFNSLMGEIEKYVNPGHSDNHKYDIKTCLNNNNELIMYVYDENMPKVMSQFNHFATIIGPKFETVCGPVFITKIIKDNDNKPIKHVDITYDDLVTLWISLKQVTCWHFNTGDKWKLKSIPNDNTSFDSKIYTHVNIESSLVFYKLKKELLEVKKYLIDNINDILKLEEYFENIFICKLKTGEYVNEELNYNSDISSVQEYIVSTAINGFDDFNKYQVVMESIFQNVDDNIVSLL